MASGRGERALAAQGSERPLGESTSTRDVTEMKSRMQCPLGTGKMTMRSPSASEVANTPPPRPVTSQTCRSVYIRDEKFTGGTLGPTRAMIDVRKQRIRQNRASKLQSLNSAKQEIEKLHAGVSQMFEGLESTLLTHPAHPSVHVQNCSDEFNVKSVQLQELQKKISVMKNELQLIDKMLKTRSDPVLPRHQMTTCTTSRQLSSRESNPIPEVCGFPIHENPFHQLSNFESHTEGQMTRIPVEVEESDEEVIPLIDPRISRTQKLHAENSKSISPVVEPVVSVQDKADSVQISSVQYMTEQATDLKQCVQDQISNQSMQGKSSTKKSTDKSSEQSAHTGAIMQENIPLQMPTVELKPRNPPTFYGGFREDVSRWINYMGNYLTFMQGTPDQQVKFAVTYLRGPAFEWWDKYVKEFGYPNNWTVMSNALKKKFGLPFRAKEAQAKIMNVRQGKRKIREYSNEFLTLLNRLTSYDESWMVNIYIWGLQRHFAKYVSAYCPEKVSKAIKIAEETEFSIWASQKDHLTQKSNGRQPNNQKKSNAAKDDQQWRQQQQKQKYQHSFEDQGQKPTEMTSTTLDLSRDLLWDVDDSLQQNSSNVHFNFLSNYGNKKAQDREVAGKSEKKSTATIWRENCTSLSRRHRADLVEKRGSVLVCDLAALTRVVGRSGPDVSRDIKNCALQSEQAQKSRHQSSRLLRREQERKMRDSVREQRQVTRLLAAAVNPSCGGTQLGMSVTPRTLHSVAEVVADKFWDEEEHH